MGVAIDIANVASNFNGATQPILFNCTCTAADNFLFIPVGTDLNTAAAVPNTVTYNGINATLLTSDTFTSNYRGTVSLWYLNNPPTGTFQVSISDPTLPSGYGAVAVPMSGVNTSLVPAFNAGNHGNATSAAHTTPVAGIADMQVAMCFSRGTSITSGGGQTQLVTPTGGGSDFTACDYIAGPTTGAFSWTFATSNFIGLGATIFGLVPPSQLGRCIFIMP